MKQFLIFLLISIFSMTLPLGAAQAKPSQEASSFTIVVGTEALDLDGLPCAPYYEGDTLMVPLELIAKALGYQVERDAETGAVTVEDAYVQRAILLDGSETVVFEGKLKIIDMSREIKNAVKTTVHQGCTFVPLEFFEEFLNTTSIDGTTITIAPSMCELCTPDIN